ncbi:MAG: sulfoxide reductase heme-binding subunit YedZ [Methylococcales symbiont of Hymedesmia sp. n. MRB-2018]|nr:MAG: sulfoxide reductase heme-binding subunit YedZ [Methylococcales symbiont of Hymedesmia sp. n. MRB-2018]KAF3983568.1 MAG: sulfoxide reductase heme-binding subunit YedZ [Methylococcales symbiont of Hymedesmia sp. n. MRB-2018]
MFLMRLSKVQWAVIKVIVFILCLMPFLLLLMDTIQDQLGANPIETLHFRLGDWALRFLCIGLSLTPLRKLLKQNDLSRFRRMLGLYAFFYASMHFLVYIVLDLSLSWEAFVDEVPKSPYILVGLLTFILLIPLAVTSTKAMQKRLGKKWLTLHKLVYVAGVTAIVHYLWLIKTLTIEAIFYASLMFVLLAYRLFTYFKARRLCF